MQKQNWTDHEFATWLRVKNAISNYKICQPVGGIAINEYYDNSGGLLCVVIFNNAECGRTIYTVTN